MYVKVDKYEIEFDESDGSLNIKRNGESWRDETGDNLIYCMLNRINELEKNEKQKETKYIIKHNPSNKYPESSEDCYNDTWGTWIDQEDKNKANIYDSIDNCKQFIESFINEDEDEDDYLDEHGNIYKAEDFSIIKKESNYEDINIKFNIKYIIMEKENGLYIANGENEKAPFIKFTDEIDDAELFERYEGCEYLIKGFVIDSDENINNYKENDFAIIKKL